jgi:hypothetical protein
MADTVTVKAITKGQRRNVYQFTGISDGTGEVAVSKLDITTLTKPNGNIPTYSRIEEIKWDVQGFTSVRLLWDHTADDVIALMSGRGAVSYEHVGGLIDPKSAGGNGAILLTSVGAIAGATYDITVVVIAK